ncbi:hypothetical protein E4U43_003535 [Claviceps pusilla]|uniref:RGS domain-containing protein n=1 Tax=Claviceps pusilla TaxID=123648 RepID=A0A9P7N792_9HYPO|nr:hypothetical protein E4U43_003535 [Claviceps pusilla]
MASSPSPEMLAQLTIYNLPPSPPNFDSIGRFFIAFGSTWTFLVFAGMIFCIFNHKNPILKIRCIPLSFGAILMLHCYWVLAQITYSVGMTMPIVLAYDIQYFFMGIYYPLGMALFYASNLRFLHVAKLQKQFTHPELRAREQKGHGDRTLLLFHMRNWGYTARVMFWIGIGIIFQIFLTIVMWFACRKYHPTFGLAGTEIKGSTLPEQLADLGRGWEWWPSLVWQLVWTWVVAPYLIWRSWGIRDTMGWRTQTIGCCLASLHAVPMFLIASYVPAFQNVNPYFSPSQWIHLSIMVFEIFTVFVPAYLVIQSWAVVRRVNASNNRWETASTTSSSVSSGSFTLVLDLKSFSSHTLSEKNKLDLLDEDLGDRLLTMTALDYVLRNNPTPLQSFSAMHDFSGENVAFLTRVARFRASWPVMPAGEQVLDVYNEALAIYTDFISTRDAEFPLNLSSRELKAQEAMFEHAARFVMGESAANAATPFDIETPAWETTSTFPPPSPAHPTDDGLVDFHHDHRHQYTGRVPDTFSLDVFDHIQSHIKYLVLTNTWPKFVSEMQQQARRRSDESNRTAVTGLSSQQSINSALSRRLAKLLRDMGL